MTAQTRTVNKGRFENGDRPSGSDFGDLIDSFVAISDSTAQTLTSNLNVPTLIATEVSAGVANVSAATIQVLVASAASVQAMNAVVATAGTLTVTGTAHVSSLNPTRLLNGFAVITAAGSTQTSAASLTARLNHITTAVAGGPQGVILPTAATGLSVIVINAANTALNVYPATGGAIWGGSTNAAIAVTASTMARFEATSGLQWYVLRGN
jgi:hypothetical protein